MILCGEDDNEGIKLFLKLPLFPGALRTPPGLQPHTADLNLDLGPGSDQDLHKSCERMEDRVRRMNKILWCEMYKNLIMYNNEMKQWRSC